MKLHHLLSAILAATLVFSSVHANAQAVPLPAIAEAPATWTVRDEAHPWGLLGLLGLLGLFGLRGRAGYARDVVGGRIRYNQ